MSFTDRLVLWLHIGVAIFTIGPVTLAISSTPRYIRRRDVPVLRYLARITVIFTIGSLLVLVFGIVLGQLDHDYSKPWLTAAATLFAVAVVLLVLIVRDQRRAIKSLTPGPLTPPPTSATAESLSGAGDDGADGRAGPDPAGRGEGGSSASGLTQPVGSGATLSADIASVERGRIAAMGGVVNVIWLVILVLMIWQP
jgi:hypothetical protein